jgi:hypothetical protein
MSEPTPEPDPSLSILSSTKKALGMEESYTPFDAELIMHINSVLADFNQLGIGPENGFVIVDKTETWDEFLIRDGDTAYDLRLNNARSLMFLRVKLLFDSPSNAAVLASIERQIEQTTWRLTVMQDSIINPYIPPVVVPVDPFE